MGSLKNSEENYDKDKEKWKRQWEKKKEEKKVKFPILVFAGWRESTLYPGEWHGFW